MNPLAGKPLRYLSADTIERIARALWAHHNRHSLTKIAFDDLGPKAQHSYREDAAIAIGVLNESSLR